MEIKESAFSARASLKRYKLESQNVCGIRWARYENHTTHHGAIHNQKARTTSSLNGYITTKLNDEAILPAQA